MSTPQLDIPNRTATNRRDLATGALFTLAALCIATLGWLAAQHRMSVAPFLGCLAIGAGAALLHFSVRRRLDDMHADLIQHMNTIVEGERKHSEQMILAVLQEDRQQQVAELADSIRTADIRALRHHDRGI
jgi:hypothetical protein